MDRGDLARVALWRGEWLSSLALAFVGDDASVS